MLEIMEFGDADDVFCVAITSGLSGSYNAACIAKQMYEADQEGARVHVIDSLSAGPELTLIVEKLEMLILQGMDYEEICETIDTYKQTTGLLFMLESLNNFAANGRVSPPLWRKLPVYWVFASLAKPVIRALWSLPTSAGVRQNPSLPF